MDQQSYKLDSVKELVDQIQNEQNEIARLQEKVAKDLIDLHIKMRAMDLTEVVGEVGKGERYTPSGRSTTVIDKQAYFNAVSLEDFMESITVSVTKARDFLSGKELQSISTKIPAEEKPETVRVKSLT
jgi:hypothetical protein